MRSRLFAATGLLGVVALLLSFGLQPVGAETAGASAPRGGGHGLPGMFVENVGQFAPGARLQLRGSDGTLWLADDALWLTRLDTPRPTSAKPLSNDSEDAIDLARPGQGVHLKLSFVGANPHPRLEPLNRAVTRVSYFHGKDPARWHADVPAWSGVRYVDLYPGVDLELTAPNGRWQPRLVVHDPAALANVRLRVDGADRLTVEGAVLQAHTRIGEITLPLLRATAADGTSLTPASQPSVQGSEVATPFASGQEQPAAVSPASSSGALIYSTYLGGGMAPPPGSNDETGEGAYGIAVDANFSAYAVGRTWSTDFPTTPGAFDTTFNGSNTKSDAFIAKLTPDGSNMVYSTYLGGSGDDDAYDVVVDDQLNAYFVGFTASSDFPVTPNAFQRINKQGGPHGDAYVAKLDPSGAALVYCTFLGGTGDDYAKGIAIDSGGAAYVTGRTRSRDFPTTPGVVQPALAGGSWDAFVAKVNPDGSKLGYSTYLGGTSDELGRGVAVQGGDAYITGWTKSSDFPTTLGSVGLSFKGVVDAFVTHLNRTGTRIEYSAYLGGSGWDEGKRIRIDSAGAVYIVGKTASSDFPTTPNAYDTTFNGASDIFVTKVEPAGNTLGYSTYLGGSDYECNHACGLQIDQDGAAYIGGPTLSANYPTTSGAYDTTYNGNGDIVVTKLNPSGSALVYSSFLGGSGEDGSAAIAVDTQGNAYVGGQVYSTDFPTTPGAFQPAHQGPASDASVSKFALPPTVPKPPYMRTENTDRTAITYKGTWINVADPNASGGSYSQSSSTTAKATFVWNGSDIQLIMTTGPNLGKAWVFTDTGNYLVDLYRPSTQYQQPVLVLENLTPGTHTMKVIPSGAKNSSSSGTAIELDAFDTR